MAIVLEVSSTIRGYHVLSSGSGPWLEIVGDHRYVFSIAQICLFMKAPLENNSRLPLRAYIEVKNYI